MRTTALAGKRSRRTAGQHHPIQVTAAAPFVRVAERRAPITNVLAEAAAGADPGWGEHAGSSVLAAHLAICLLQGRGPTSTGTRQQQACRRRVPVLDVYSDGFVTLSPAATPRGGQAAAERARCAPWPLSAGSARRIKASDRSDAPCPLPTIVRGAHQRSCRFTFAGFLSPLAARPLWGHGARARFPSSPCSRTLLRQSDSKAAANLTGALATNRAWCRSAELGALGAAVPGLRDFCGRRGAQCR
jgi:hypothetical protein